MKVKARLSVALVYYWCLGQLCNASSVIWNQHSSASTSSLSASTAAKSRRLTSSNSRSSSTSAASSRDSTAARPILGGPHVCGSRWLTFCCPGWAMKPGTRMCLIHIGSGGPCTTACLNGGTCMEAKCSCREGYSGQFCSEPICEEPCLNGGRCIGPNRCACVYGFTGRRCEADYRTGPCYTKLAGGNQCAGELSGLVCTKQICCATIGKAWGHPCEKCPLDGACDRGFIKHLLTGPCVDVDECEAIPNICAGGKCHNTVGSYRCVCDDGQEWDELSGTCVAGNPCDAKVSPCGDHGTCISDGDTYYCMCDLGYIHAQDKKGCIDARRGTCYTDMVLGSCRNPLPFQLTKLDCCCGANLGKGWGKDVCETCPQPGEDGYERMCGDAPRRLKHPIDECALKPDLCGSGECVDLPDGYMCRCFPGYSNATSSSKDYCEDVNECLEPGICKPYGKCVNTPGSFYCECLPGYETSGDGKSCVDYDECKQNGVCSNGYCENSDGSFQCRCKEGYRFSASMKSCVDIDECREDRTLCENGVCRNLAGGFQCVCDAGYTLSPDGTMCLDTDECSVFDQCQNGRCINSPGSFGCICDQGFRSPDGVRCFDVDECLQKPCIGGQCDNVPGSFRCICDPGFTLSSDGRTCLDTREGYCYAAYENGNCQKPSRTIMTKSMCCCGAEADTMAWGSSTCELCPMPGSSDYHKLCPFGAGKSFSGNDINECYQYPSVCENGACENMIGTYRCSCNPGYRLDLSGKKCVNIDECSEESPPCRGGQCIDTPGSYKCVCPEGTQLNATGSCEDVDECKTQGASLCVGGSCINLPGSYRCACADGYVLDPTGNICLNNRKGSCWFTVRNGRCENNVGRLTLKSECCCSIGQAWGSPCKICDKSDCDCDPGFAKYDGRECTDINECELDADICKGGGKCINTDGSFFCQCPEGMNLDSTGRTCIDNREELCYLKYRGGMCTDPLPGFFKKVDCCCTVGQAWGDRCKGCPRPGTKQFSELCPDDYGIINGIDVNECVLIPEVCRNGRCKNTRGGFKCICNPGYAEDEDKLTCVDYDECAIMSGVCGNGTCRNVEGSFRCDCDLGYESMEMMQPCVDINECKTISGLCKGGECVNTPGSFFCKCPPGHEVSADGTACDDVNECSQTSEICSNGVCENMMGTYQCVCNEGYQQPGLKSHCEDIDECGDGNGGCQESCMNMMGSYSCTCRSGYELLPDGRSCADIDECAVNPRICDGGTCHNTDGSYLCICETGYTPAENDQKCEDVDECYVNDICGEGTCINTKGSYKCDCLPGFVIPIGGDKCVDEDECALRIHDCDPNADCSNTIGSYTCTCLDGFRGDGKECTNMNECLNANQGNCHRNARCVDTEGSYMCVCDEGFEGDGFMCKDVDECKSRSLCRNGKCENLPGTYRCLCDFGYVNPDGANGDKNAQACEDVDECNTFDEICKDGRCENVAGSFKCICDKGFKLDDGQGGWNCTDIDECKNPQQCLHGTCRNTIGTYECVCPPNYSLNVARTACVDTRIGQCYADDICSMPMGHSVRKSTCCCGRGRSWGSRCDECPEPGTDEYESLCPGGPGLRPNIETGILEDIDECLDFPLICNHGKCTNNFGGFVCTCHKGFKLIDEITCEDIDECETEDVCKNGRCSNTVGSFICHCPPGFVLKPDGSDCVDMRREPCYTQYSSKGVCSTPTTGLNMRKADCCCSVGKAWGRFCEPCPTNGSVAFTDMCGTSRPGLIMTEDINECALMPNICPNGECVNTEGSFYCVCDHGYEYNADSNTCSDVNECLEDDFCTGVAECNNKPGSFECQCPGGYRLSRSGLNCEDIDECLESPGICENGRCKNTEGSFRCLCNEGFELSSSGDVCIDIDECHRVPDVCGKGECINTAGSYRCDCFSGFRVTASGTCADIDECRESGLCRLGKCKNAPGSFYCECSTGYELSPDMRTCRDINECLERPDVCPPPGKCQNFPGSFFCQCPPGYTLSADRKKCIDIDECAKGDPCVEGTCENTPGSFRCYCAEGWALDHSGTVCIDRREENCFNSYLGDRCLDLRQEPMTRKECCCTMGKGWGSDDCRACPPLHSKEFKKLCPDGPGRGEKGEDLNECALIPEPCTGGGTCVNTDGSYRCECPPGYVLDATLRNCVDDDECSKNPRVCGNGTCSNAVGGFHCSCATGFAPGPDGKCVDVDECAESNHNCAFRCLNNEGSYRCICPYGYSLAPDGQHCQDVDECAARTSDCRPPMQCKNLIGGFTCVCPEGYEEYPPGSKNCRDVNECQTTSGICENGMCVNIPGGFICECNEGFRPSSRNRTDCAEDQRTGYCYQSTTRGHCTQDSRSRLKVSKAGCCCSMGKAWGPHCELCPPLRSRQYQSLCLEAGFLANGADIDECATIPGLCKNGRCINTMGSYKCACDRGYERDATQTRCVDVNECDAQPKVCDHGCKNTPGSFECTCPNGYTLSSDGRRCLDVDECAKNLHTCSHTCINTQGSYKCACPPGYSEMAPDQCMDINECAEQPELCQPHGVCRNTPGSYKCVCPRGYQLDDQGIACIDVDECEDDTKCEYGCQNLLGSYACTCIDGLVPHNYWKKVCVDVDECSSDPCGSAMCQNAGVGYKCMCPNGYEFDSVQLVCVQATAGCSSSICAFNCRPLGNAYSCGCPSGYQTIGQGHCLLSAGSSSHRSSTRSGYDFGSSYAGTNLGQIEYHDPAANNDNVISTEGCFSCKLNKRNQRSKRSVNVDSNHNWAPLSTYNSSVTSDYDHFLDDEIVDSILIKIRLDQTKHRTAILQLLPSVIPLQRKMRYHITQGNESGYFHLKENGGIVTLHFSKRLTHPKPFDLTIMGTPKRKIAEKVLRSSNFQLSLRIIVVN